MDFEYRVWAKTSMWQGEIDADDYPRCRVPVAVIDALIAARPRLHWQGSVKKRFPDELTTLFLDFGTRLLSAADAAETISWLRSWAAGTIQPASAGSLPAATATQPTPRAIRRGAAPTAGETAGHAATRIADWLERASADGYLIDWEA